MREAWSLMETHNEKPIEGLRSQVSNCPKSPDAAATQFNQIYVPFFYVFQNMTHIVQIPIAQLF